MKLRLDTFIFALVFFTNPLVLSRVVIANDVLSLTVYGGLLSYVFIKAITILKQCESSRLYLSALVLMTIYLIYTCSIRYLAGESFSNILQHGLALGSGILLLILLTNYTYQTRLVSAYLLALILHTVTIFPFFDSLTLALSENTGYATGEYSIGIFQRRATGFFNSPGYLSMFAVGGIALGLVGLKQNPNGMNRLLIFFSLVLGFSAFSRSFVIVFSGIALVYLVAVNIKAKFKVILFSSLFFLILLNNNTFEDYSEYVTERLANTLDWDNNDRVSGDTGILATLNAIKNAPVFGSAISLDGGSLMAWDGEAIVKPHCSLLAILAFYGIAGCWSVYFLIFKGYSLVLKELFSGRLFLLDNPFLLGFAAINILCLVEPLIETNLYFFFLFGMLLFDKLKQHNLYVLYSQRNLC